jgi:hypothetical protein
MSTAITDNHNADREQHRDSFAGRLNCDREILIPLNGQRLQRRERAFLFGEKRVV